MKVVKLAVALLLLVAVVLGAAGDVAADAVQAKGGPTTACGVMNDPFWDSGMWTSVGWNLGIAYPFYAGDTVYVTAGPPEEVETLPTTFSYQLDGATVATTAYPGTLVYVVPADVLVTDFLAQIDDGLAVVTWSASCVPAPPPEEEVVEVVPVPGCDLALTIPSTAVVGAFVTDGPTYYEPGKMTNPVVTISADQTAWVLGTDASGAYYKIVWVCQYLWVPVGTLGPNYDAVWNGTPLPTGVVE